VLSDPSWSNLVGTEWLKTGPSVWPGGMGRPDSWIELAGRQVTEAGLAVEEAARADQRIHFSDIAAVVYYLKAISWSIPGYRLEKHRDRLRALHEDARAWPVITHGYRFLLVASKPG
jgi:hypothetical protein